MNNFLKFAWLPLGMWGLYRTILNLVWKVDAFAFQSYSKTELEVVAICFFFAMVSFWHNIIRARCPNCRGVDHGIVGEEEVDRFIGSKEVSGTDGKGRTTKNHVSVTYRKMKNRHRCKSCQHTWYSHVNREMA